MEEENNNVDNAKKTAKNVARKTGKIVKTVLSPIAIILIVILIVIIMIAAFTKIVKIEKGTNKPDDPKNAPGAVTNYANSVTIDEDGNMTFDKTAQEFWDELKKNNNDLLDYFDSPEELAKVMNASLVTEYLDTREDPSKEIDWSKINNDVNSKNAQGIVKLKRKNEAEAEFYMTYVSPKKFQELIDNYNNNPTKKNQVEAMRHFTLEKKKIGSSSRLSGINLTGGDMEEIIWNYFVNDLGMSETAAAGAMGNFACEAGFVTNNLENWVNTELGMSDEEFTEAVDNGSFTHDQFMAPIYHSSTGKTSQWGYGIGSFTSIDIKEMLWKNTVDEGKSISDLEGQLKTIAEYYGEKFTWINNESVDQAAADYFYYIEMGNPYGGTNGYGYEDTIPNRQEAARGYYEKYKGTTSSDKTSNSDNKNKDSSSNNKKDSESENSSKDKTSSSSSNSKKTTGKAEYKQLPQDAASVGYDHEYTSSTGFTYKEFKQFLGPWAGDPYWGETMTSAGCGPTAIAIVASGLQPDLNLTPKEIGSDMNATYGSTNYSTLMGELKRVGLESTYIDSPSSQQILEQLKSGKIMLTSVGAGSGFANWRHIMAIVDINKNDEVFVLTSSGSSVLESGWYNPDQITLDCNYILPIDTGRIGVADITGSGGSSSSASDSRFVAKIVTFSEITNILETNDPDVEGAGTKTNKRASSMEVNYQEMVSPYSMPFDYLWALLIIGQDKDFVMDLADLMYNSEFIITVHDSTKTVTNVRNDNYTKEQRNTYEGMCRAIVRTTNGNPVAKSENISPKEDYNHLQYYQKYTEIYKTYSETIGLTLVDTWCVKYEPKYDFLKTETSSPTETEKIPSTEEIMIGTEEGISNSSFKKRIEGIVIAKCLDVENRDESKDITTMWTNASSTHYSRTINWTRTIDKNVVDKKYTLVPSEHEWKVDKDSKENNFVKLLYNNYNARTNIKSVDEWLFQILERNEDTKNKVELTKFLLHNVTGEKYIGIDEDFKFEEYLESAFSSVDATSASSSTTVTQVDGDFLKTAQKVWKEVCDRIHYYDEAGHGSQIPISQDQNYIDCSAYVSWVLYEYGYTEFGGYQKNTSTFLGTNWNAKYGWEEISVASGENPYDLLKPGDLFVRVGGGNHHITLVVEKKDGKIYCYDGGVKRNTAGGYAQDGNGNEIPAWQGANGNPVDRTFFLTSVGDGKIIRVKPQT